MLSNKKGSKRRVYMRPVQRYLRTIRKTYFQNGNQVQVSHNNSNSGYKDLSDKDIAELKMIALKDTRQGRKAKLILTTSKLGELV
jgi:hypothetical protein